MSAITLKSVEKTYRIGELNVPVLKGIDLSVEKGESLAIMGPSGSGKSTLMNLIGLLDRPTSGEVLVEGQRITLDMSDSTLAHLRAARIGFVFQSFQLLPRLSALENVLLPTLYRKEGRADRTERAKGLLDRLGLKERMLHNPTELSGGEKQRVAIARSLMNDPGIVLADEPTGNLDSKSGKEVMQILTSLSREGKSLILITHDPAIARTLDRTVEIFDGLLVKGGIHGR